MSEDVFESFGINWNFGFLIVLDVVRLFVSGPLVIRSSQPALLSACVGRILGQARFSMNFHSFFDHSERVGRTSR